MKMHTIKFPLNEPPKLPKKEEARKSLDKLIKTSDEVLYKVKSFWPLDFFPDQITVDRTKIDVVYGIFFWTKEVISIQIENVYEVTVDYTIFFATITIRVNGIQVDPPPISCLKKDEAIRLRKIITGLIVARREKVDLNVLSVEEVRNKVEQIGDAQQN